MTDVREYTNKLLEGIEEGIYDKDYVILAFCKYMSEDDVKDMMEANELIEEEEKEGWIKWNIADSMKHYH